MEQKIKFLLLTLLGLYILFGYITPVESDDAISSLVLSPKKEVQIKVSHEQEVWISALEWCESRGNVDAINPKDLDNTPSYYSWQWKPSTFKYFALKYNIVSTTSTDMEIKKLMHDYPTERKVVTSMVLDQKNIRWNQQFPWCIKKIGLPPKVMP